MEQTTTFDDEGLLYSQTYDDLYFSRQDGRAECAHVFIAGNGLPARWSKKSDFFIGELGFGTGLNFLETWRQWIQVRKPGQHLVFTSVEAEPLSRETAQEALSLWPEISDLSDRLLDNYDHVFDGVDLDDHTTLKVHLGDCLECISAFPACDAWYLDGFSPAKNPAMWSAELMAKIASRTAVGGTFASYTAAGWVRRNLEAAGFEVEKKPGFGTKRDMIVGTKS